MKVFMIIFLLLFVCSCALITKGRQEKSTAGLVIKGFSDDSNLKSAGAEVGDVLLKYDGETLYSVYQLDKLKQKVKTNNVEIILVKKQEHVALTIPSGKLGVYLAPHQKSKIISKDAVTIDGIGKLGYGLGMDISFFASLKRLEEIKGEGYSYNDLIGFSGYGMRTCYYPGACPSSPDPSVGYNTGNIMLKKLGYEFEYLFLEGMEDQANHPEVDYLSSSKIIAKIVKSIDDGWPVMAVNLIGAPEWGLVCGYQNNGKQLLCRTYFDNGEEYNIAHNVPFVSIIFKGKKETDTSKLYEHYFSNMNDLFNIEYFESYANGLNAYKVWINDLMNEENFQSMDKQVYQETGFANSWIYFCLSHARSNQYEFLKNHRAEIDLPAKKIDSLIENYRSISEILSLGNNDLPPMMGTINRDNWTKQMREKQILTLQEALVIETELAQSVNIFPNKKKN